MMKKTPGALAMLDTSAVALSGGHLNNQLTLVSRHRHLLAMAQQVRCPAVRAIAQLATPEAVLQRAMACIPHAQQWIA